MMRKLVLGAIPLAVAIYGGSLIIYSIYFNERLTDSRFYIAGLPSAIIEIPILSAHALSVAVGVHSESSATVIKIDRFNSGTDNYKYEFNRQKCYIELQEASSYTRFCKPRNDSPPSIINANYHVRAYFFTGNRLCLIEKQKIFTFSRELDCFDIKQALEPTAQGGEAWQTN